MMNCTDDDDDDDDDCIQNLPTTASKITNAPPPPPKKIGFLRPSPFPACTKNARVLSHAHVTANDICQPPVISHELEIGIQRGFVLENCELLGEGFFFFTGHDSE